MHVTLHIYHKCIESWPASTKFDTSFLVLALSLRQFLQKADTLYNSPVTYNRRRLVQSVNQHTGPKFSPVSKNLRLCIKAWSTRLTRYLRFYQTILLSSPWLHMTTGHKILPYKRDSSLTKKTEKSFNGGTAILGN